MIEAVHAMYDFCQNNKGNYMMCIVGSEDECMSTMCGSQQDLIPAMTISILEDEPVKELVIDALSCALDDDIQTAHEIYKNNNPMN